MDLAFRHLSVRIPWHDSAWNGAVCRQPRDNAACICLPAIRETRDDAWEESVAGRRFTVALGVYGPPSVGRYKYPTPDYTTTLLDGTLANDPRKFAAQRYALISSNLIVAYPTLSVSYALLKFKFE